jgi:hypothetical protein
MTLNTITSGIDTSFSTKLNRGIGKALVVGAISNLLAAGSTSTNVDSEVVGTIMNTEFDRDNSTSVYCDLTDSAIAGGTTYDNCNDSSIGAGQWTSSVSGAGSASEDTNRLAIDSGKTGSVTLTSNGSSALNMNSGTYYVLMDLEINNVGGSFNIQVTNTTTTVSVYAASAGEDYSRRAFLLRVNSSTNRADLYHHSAKNTWTLLGAGNVDISTVTTNKYLRFNINGPGGGGSENNFIYIRKISYYTSSSTGTVTTATKALPATSTSAAAGALFQKNGSTNPTFEVSANSGSNYTSATKDVLTTIGTSGTGGKIRVTVANNGNTTPDEIYAIGGVFG